MGYFIMKFFFAKHRIFLSRLFSLILLSVLLVSKPQMYGTLFYNILFIIGLWLVLIGILGRIFASFFMSDNRNVSVVSKGLYSITRNPLYLFSFIGMVGVALCYGSIIVLGILIISYAIYYSQVIAFEEKSLSQKIGSSYINYLNSGVPRFFPDFKRWDSDLYLRVNYKVVLKTTIEASYFFLVVLFLIIMLKLQELDIIPYFFTIL